MKILLNVRMALLLVAVGLLTVLSSCGELDTKGMDEFAEQQESFLSSTVRAENVTVTGRITAHETNRPLGGATVQIGNQSTLTNDDGTFRLVLEEANGVESASISLRGCTDLFFTVDFSGYEDGETVEWSAQLSRLQRPIQYTPGEQSLTTFNYLGNPYVVNIPADAASEPFEVHVGPSGTIVGKGIPGVFALINLNIQTADEIGSNGVDNFRFAEAISVIFDVLESSKSGGFGTLNPAALQPGANAEAAAAAENYKEALNNAYAVLNAGGSREDATKALITELFGDEDADADDDVDGVLLDENGNFVLSSDFSGILIPGVGVLTRDGKLIRINNEGEIVETIDLLDPNNDVPIPHQGTADGEG